jgi:hypothetical protein
MTRKSVCCIAPLVLVAVTSRPTAAQGTRDSAGIRIIDNDRPVWSAQDGPRLSLSPVLVIGDRPEPDYTLSRVAGAVRLSDGRIVVADGGSLQLRFFDSLGTFIDVVGGRGGGPGEFTRLDALATLAGDTISALSVPRAVTFFDPQGEFLRRVDASRVPAGLPDGLKVVVAVLGDQSIVVGSLPMPSPRPRGTRWVDSIPLVVVGRDTAARVPLGTFPFMLMAMNGSDRQPPWFGPTAVVAAGGSSLFAGYGAEYSIRIFSSAGRLERIIRRRWTPVRVTRADIDRYVAEWAKRWIRATGPEAEQEKRDLRDDPYASEVPAYSQFIADRAGRLWVREAHLADAPGAGQLGTSPLVPSVWSLFDHAGRWLGDVTMPARFLPTDIGPDYVLGIARDRDGVETVVQYQYGTGARFR